MITAFAKIGSRAPFSPQRWEERRESLLRSLCALRIFAVTVIGLQCGSALAVTVRSDHPRIFITRETVPNLRKRCETTHRELFQKMKALCDKGDGGAVQQALCYVVTGERKYANAAKASVWKDPEQRPGLEV